MLSPKLKQRIVDEVPGDDGFRLQETQDEFINVAKYLKVTLDAEDKDVIEILKNIYEAMVEECDI